MKKVESGCATYLEHIGNNHEANLGSANVHVFELADLAVASGQRNVLHVAVHAVLGLWYFREQTVQWGGEAYVGCEGRGGNSGSEEKRSKVGRNNNNDAPSK